jgi:hypothetical protein
VDVAAHVRLQDPRFGADAQLVVIDLRSHRETEPVVADRPEWRQP